MCCLISNKVMQMKSYFFFFPLPRQRYNLQLKGILFSSIFPRQHFVNLGNINEAIHLFFPFVVLPWKNIISGVNLFFMIIFIYSWMLKAW